MNPSISTNSNSGALQQRSGEFSGSLADADYEDDGRAFGGAVALCPDVPPRPATDSVDQTACAGANTIGARTYLGYIHSFRAVAILFVVAAHCIPLFDWSRTPGQGQLLSSLMPNCTVFFVFVAGFLFQHLSWKFEYRRYMKRKLRNIFLPYVIVSLPIIMFHAFTKGVLFNLTYLHNWLVLARNVVWSLLAGYPTLVPYWFIPMIALFYLFAPALLWVDRDGRLYYFLPLLLVVTVFVHRPSNFNHIWQFCAYFLPVYLYGMWFSRHRERVLAWHERWLPGLMTLVAVLVWLEVGYFHRAGFISSAAMFSTEHGIVDTNAVQKLLLCGVLLVILRRFGNVVDHRLSYLGDISFGIYFLHMYFITGLRLANGVVTPIGNVLRYGLAVAIAVSLSVGFLWITKHLLGRHRRSVVGC